MMRPSEERFSLQMGQNHKLFGVKYLHSHEIRDERWQTTDKLDQYANLCNVLEKNQKFTNLKLNNQRAKQLRKLKYLRNDLKRCSSKVKIALHGNIHRTKAIVQNHRELQRICMHIPPDKINDHVFQQIFFKRKEFDRLTDKRNQLTERYEQSLMEFAKLQDRVLYEDVFESKDSILAKKLRLELRNSQTRARAIKCINIAFKKVIDIMTHDSLYFDTALSGLLDDLKEQDSFIKKTIELGLPALANLDQLSKEYNLLEEQTKKGNKICLQTLVEHRERIRENNRKVIELVRRDSAFSINPNRYARETPSMTDLKTQLEDVEKVMKIVKNETSCSIVEDIYPRMKKLILDDQELVKQLERKEYERDACIEYDEHAHVIRESLQHNVTDEEIERLNEINNLKHEIKMKQQEQSKLEDKIKERGEIFCLIKTSFQHIDFILKNVEPIRSATKPPYPNQDLDLPLLKFVSFKNQQKQPPLPTEENLEFLLKNVKDKTMALMSVYGINEKSPAELEVGIKTYHNVVFDILKDEVVQITADAHEDESQLIIPPEDISVPTRYQIKSTSKKIVDANAKLDE